MMNWILAASMMLPQLGLAADAANYRILLKGPDLGDLNQIKNCIDYTVCSYASSTFARAPGQSTMEINVKLDRDEYRTVADRCLFSYQGRFEITVDREGVEEALPTSTTSGPWGAKPVYLTGFSHREHQAFQRQIDVLLERKAYNEAIAFTSQAYGLNFGDYSVSYSPNAKIENNAVTHHNSKTVEVGSGFVRNSCYLILALRHEAEHVYQQNRYMTCKALGKTTAFQDRLYRERSAYLNDVVNIRRFCASDEFIVQQVPGRYKFLFEHYAEN